jgi:DNA-binding GntR family transcriptional regulator
MTDHISLPWEQANPRSVAQKIAGYTARDIVRGALAPGELLTESGLAEQFTASRTPAREALLALQKWGLVRLLPKKGAVVTAVSPAERRDLIDVRTGWEVRAIEVLADDPDRRRVLAAELDVAVQAQVDALQRGDLLDFAGADFRFHLRIIEAGGNAVVRELLDLLAPRFARLTQLAVADDPANARVLREQHGALAALAADGDAAGFGATMAEHVVTGHFRGGSR